MYKEFVISLDIKSLQSLFRENNMYMTNEELYECIQRILNNKSYSDEFYLSLCIGALAERHREENIKRKKRGFWKRLIS